MIYVCPEHDAIVQTPCDPCSCGMDKLPAFAPNPIARLVGELPNLRERLAKATPGPWRLMEGIKTLWIDAPEADHSICDLDVARPPVQSPTRATAITDGHLIAASPSTHAIAIEAIERLERVEKALTANVTFEEDNGSDEFTDGYWSGVAALRKAINAALAASNGDGT